MSGAGLAAGAAAAALFYISRKSCAVPDEPAETHRGHHEAPQGWQQNLFFFAESLRYTYGETLGRWRTADLLIGLAYLARKEGTEHAAADIAAQARPLGVGMSLEELEASMAELQVVERFMRYCFVMRERKMQTQRDMFGALGIGEADILMHELRAGVLKPSFVLVRDHALRSVVLSIRGTHSFKDMFTSLTGASKPHHLVDSNGVVLGYSHFGMLAAARWVKQQTLEQMEQALADNPGYSLRIVGHSLGGGTAALLTMMLRERGGAFAGATCVALACPSCMTLELARSCADYVTTVVNGADVVPTVSPGAADLLREEVMKSSWFIEFRRDVRSSSVVRAVETGLRGVGSATWSATSWTTAKLSACYPRRRLGGSVRTLKRRNSDDWGSEAGQAGSAEWGVASAADEAEALLEQQQGSGSGSATVAAIRSVTHTSVLGMLSSPPPAGRGGSGGAASPSPVGLAGSTRALHPHGQHHQGSARRGAVWGQRIVGWGQQVSTLTGRGAMALGSSSKAAMRSTGGLLARVWSQSCRLPDGSGGALPTQLAAAGDEAGCSPGPGQAPSMEQQMEDSEAEERREDEAVAEMVGGMDAADRDQLKRELALRMSEVEAAVCDAEAEERRRGGDEDSLVPSVIRPGSYGTDGARGPLVSPAKQDARWRRTMYPAGRILHLVPASLLEPPAPSNSSGCSGSEAPDTPRTPRSPASGSGGDCEAWLPRASAGAAASPPSSPPAGAGPAEGEESGQQQQPHHHHHHRAHHSKHASVVSLEDMMAGEEPVASSSGDQRTGSGERPSGGGSVSGAGSEDGMVWVPGQGGSGRADAEQEHGGSGGAGAPGGGLAEGSVLLDWVPQQAYGRIKLCRRMLADHFIPSYLAALESAQRRLAEQRVALLAERQQAAAEDPSQALAGLDAAMEDV